MLQFQGIKKVPARTETLHVHQKRVTVLYEKNVHEKIKMEIRKKKLLSEK